MDRRTCFSLGTDRIQRIGTSLIVISRVAMDQWQPREYRRTAVWHDGVQYVVAGRTTDPRVGTIRYRLDPWPADEAELPGAEIFYDLSFVEARDRLQAGLALILLLDAIMRWSLSHGGFQAGFGEWLVRRGG